MLYELDGIVEPNASYFSIEVTKNQKAEPLINCRDSKRKTKVRVMEETELSSAEEAVKASPLGREKSG